MYFGCKLFLDASYLSMDYKWGEKFVKKHNKKSRQWEFSNSYCNYDYNHRIKINSYSKHGYNHNIKI